MIADEIGPVLNKDEEYRNKILIIDDDAVNVKLLAGNLEKDYEIIPAYNGEEGLRIIEFDKPDIVLLDIMMPKISGYEVCERIKRQDATRFTPVVIITALSDLDAKIKAIEIGADDFLTKPINRMELTTRVKSLLKIKYLHDQLVNSKKIMEAQNEALLKKHDELKIKIHERTMDLIRVKLQSIKRMNLKG
jgi:two-component system, cell cycle response regulator